MPFFRLETNVAASAIDDMDGLLKSLSKELAKVLKKPESYVNVAVVPGVHMIMGGSSDPCGSAYLMSIGSLGTSENKKVAAAIYPILEKHTGIKPTRCYIEFKDAETSIVGYNGTTFHEIFG